MAQHQHEGEPAVIAVDMADPQRAGREPARQLQPQPQGREEIMIADEVQRPALDLEPQRDADAAADMFLEAGRPAEALAGPDHLRKAPPPAVEPGPILPAAAPILADAD